MIPAGKGGERRIDSCEYAIKVLINVGVPESQHGEAFVGEMPVALRVPPGLRRKPMLPPVDFNDQTPFQANEVNDVIVAW